MLRINNIDGMIQQRHNCIANALVFSLFGIKPLLCTTTKQPNQTPSPLKLSTYLLWSIVRIWLLTLVAAPLILSNCSMCPPRFSFSIFLRVVPESGVISKPVISPIWLQWRGRIPLLHITEIRGMFSWREKKTIINKIEFNSLWPIDSPQGDAIWRHRSGSILAQVMACCLTAPSHYLKQCLLIISEVLWHPPESNFILNAFSYYSVWVWISNF